MNHRCPSGSLCRAQSGEKHSSLIFPFPPRNYAPVPSHRACPDSFHGAIRLRSLQMRSSVSLRFKNTPSLLLGSSKAVPSSAAHRGCVNMEPEGSAGREAVLKLPVHLPLQGTTTQASHSRRFYENVQLCPREKGQATDSWRGKGRVPCSSLQPMWGL